MLRTVYNWLETRTGLPAAVADFLNDPIPRSTGWRNTFGSVAGALILLQMLTGFLLMIYYVPHPDAAYESLEYVEESVTAGSFVRALHYWGASFVFVALFVHACRVFYSGAYRKPREATWLVGIALFGVIFGFVFTGQLLPFNQAGYWAANVGIEIASSAPVAGPYIKSLLVGGETLGALTLTRFYAGHVVLLPVLLGLLVPLHLYLLRKYGPVRPEGDTTSETEPFAPRQLTRDFVAITLVFTTLFAVGLMVGGPHSDPADPGDTSYIPHPEWYLMSHFQVLKITPGNLKILATFVLPNLLVLALVALPFIDRSKTPAFRERRPIIAAGTVVIASIVVLTAWGTATMPEQGSTPRTDIAGYDPVAAGRAIYEEHDCASCHIIDGEGEQVGPDLSNIGDRLKRDYMADWISDPQSFQPDTQMPPFNGNQRELEELTAYLQTLRAGSG